MSMSGLRVRQAIAEVGPVETSSRGAVRMFLRNKAAVLGLVVFTLIILVTVFGPGLYGVSAKKMVAPPFLGPGDDLGPLFGTDYLGGTSWPASSLGAEPPSLSPR